MSLSNAINVYEFIDRKSYILGMMMAFAECVTNEGKKVARYEAAEKYQRYVCEGSA
jgi:hypothetical protein